MNNYHLFLIRSDVVTQITGHLLAGLVTLALVLAIVSPDTGARDEAGGPLAESHPTLPAGSDLIVASK